MRKVLPILYRDLRIRGFRFKFFKSPSEIQFIVSRNDIQIQFSYNYKNVIEKWDKILENGIGYIIKCGHLKWEIDDLEGYTNFLNDLDMIIVEKIEIGNNLSLLL